MPNKNKAVITRPNGLPSISNKAAWAIAIQAVATLAIVLVEGGVTAEAFPTALTAVITALMSLKIKDTLPDGTEIAFPSEIEVSDVPEDWPLDEDPEDYGV